MVKISKLLNFSFDFISKKLGLNIRHLFTYFLSKLYSNRVDEKLLVFGSTNGKAFSGNSKYLFLYLKQNSNYKCVWITDSQEVVRDFQDRNYDVISTRELFKAIKILKAAKYIFITHGFGDFLMIDFSPKTQLIRLSHGIGIKNLTEKFSNFFVRFYKKKIRQYLVKSISYIAVTSEKDIQIKKYSYPLPSNKFLKTGFPRNDILVNYATETYFEIKRSLNIEKNNEVLLYAPTQRRYERKSPLDESFFKKLDTFLINENKVMLFKPHPNSEKINLDRYTNIKSVEPKFDIMDLLVISDLLITDYSSVFFDFLITKRPIIFFAYDLEEYKMKRGLYFDYETFVPGPIVKTGDELLLKLKTLSQWTKDFEVKRNIVVDTYTKYSDGNSNKKIIEILGLKLI
ncbi:MAG: CDP-glycerol glycerophosphotransferase family protein [Candidatus Thorarchaeota archaeon]